MNILPRRRLIHPTMQPIHSAVKHNRPTVIVRVIDAVRTAAEYRESAELLHSLGLYVAADLLDATASKLESRRPMGIAVSRAITETVVEDVDHTVNHRE